MKPLKMKPLIVKLKNGQSVIHQVHENDTAESFLRDAGKHVLLNGTTYLKEDIVSVTEQKPRKGSTNMEGI